MPTYVVLDTSKSMEPHESLLNTTLAKIINTLYASPRIAEFIHLSIVTFSTAPHVVLPMREIAKLTRMPAVKCRGATNFGPAFELLRDRIELDIPAMSAAGVQVLRPVIFLLTDGAPSDRPASRWEESLKDLLDPGWRPHPHIITYGFGDAVEEVLKRMSTLAAYIADGDRPDDGEALATALSSLLNSLVASAQARQLRLPENVDGYRSIPLEPVDI